jgi:RNA polymerase sigma-70 factor (ECF subfamily)
MPELSDEIIAQHVQEGEQQAFGTLVERYEQKLLRYARKFLFDPEESRDVVQEVFIKAYTNIKSFKTDQRFSPWIYRIAHNEFINRGKKRQRHPVFYFDFFDTLIPHPQAKESATALAERNDLRRELDQHLAALSPKYREPLVLYYFEELDYTEIADILQIPVSTVGVRLARGRQQLKKLLTAAS